MIATNNVLPIMPLLQGYLLIDQSAAFRDTASSPEMYSF